MQKGVSLVIVLVVMSILALTVVSLTTVIIEGIRFTTVAQDGCYAYYMALSGIHYALWRYRIDGTQTGNFTTFTDRGFNWTLSRHGNILTINSTGYSPASGTGIIQRTLIATYHRQTRELLSLNYG